MEDSYHRVDVFLPQPPIVHRTGLPVGMLQIHLGGGKVALDQTVRSPVLRRYAASLRMLITDPQPQQKRRIPMGCAASFYSIQVGEEGLEPPTSRM